MAYSGPVRSASGEIGPQHRPDASMDLLREITETAVDPAYTRERAWRASDRRARLLTVPVYVVAAMLFAMSAMFTTRAAPQIERDRQQLISGIEEEQTRQDDLRARISATRTEVYGLEQHALASDAGRDRIADQTSALGVPAGAVPVEGPGVTVVVDDGPDGGQDSRVIDTDLQQLVNGMWQAGAEAIAINGHRLTSLTAIRGAGDAITVDYRSLTRPYTVQVIGDPDTLEKRFATTDGGVWWGYLRDQLGVSWSASRQKRLTLPETSRLTLRTAEGGPR